MKERDIFDAALAIIDPDQRGAFLAAACEGDTRLEEHLCAMLRAQRDLGSFLETPALRPTVDATDLAPLEGSGTVIGPYRLLEPIGEGGMGVVYLAEQTDPVGRKVALKVIKPGMDTKQVVARFEAERQALALMDHPSIARVHDGGMTPSGRPYFVMELVRGIPITEYCDRERLSIRDRLELFVLVCRAVQHAHQKGIIHRDLKPSNILVTVIDGVGVPKVIDFGVAKATGGSLTERTLFTGFHQFVGTPLYMSPEQADLSGTDVDTRSDVYSLGVLLYELLTGTTPFNQETLRQAAFDEMRRIIREEQPPTPSTRLRLLGESLSTVSDRRKADPRRLSSSIKGELDWVVMKALEKDRSRRYETANGLAADVMRHLNDRPIEACPPSARYRLSKFIRRNRLVFSAAILALAGLAVGTAVSIWQAIRATRSADEARQVVEYLVEDVFGAAATKESGRNLTILEVLRAAEGTIEAKFRAQPLIEASIRMTMSKVYEDLGRRQDALTQNERAFRLRRHHLGAADPETLDAANNLVILLRVAGRKDEAIEMGRWVLSTRQRVLGPRHPDTIFSEARLAYMLRGAPEDLAEMTLLAERAAAAASRFLGPDHYVTVAAKGVLQDVHLQHGEFDSAIAIARDTSLGMDRIFGPHHPEARWASYHLTKALEAGGRIDEALVNGTETLERFSSACGVSHVDTCGQVGTLNRLLRVKGDFNRVRDLTQDWLVRVRAIPTDPDPWSRLHRSEILGNFAFTLATLPEPIQRDEELLLNAAEEAVALDDTSENGHAVLALVYDRRGLVERAWGLITAALTRSRSDEQAQLCRLVQAWLLARAGRIAEGREAYDRLVDRLPRDDPWRFDIHAFRCSVAESLGRPRPPEPPRAWSSR